jgi:hypothetical protein
MIEGIFSGKTIKNKGIPEREIQYGPLVIPRIADPIDDMITRTIGEVPYEANGVVEWRPENIQFLGS